MANGKNSDDLVLFRAMSLDLSRFHATFFAESLEGLDSVEHDLLELEQGIYSKDKLDAIFRAVHSLKGSAGSLGFAAIAGLAHEMESVLDRLRQGTMTATPECTNVLLRGIDRLRHWLYAAEAKEAVDAETGTALVRELQVLLKQSANAASATHGQENAEQVTRSKQRYAIVFRPAQDFFHSGNDPARFIEELARLGTIQSTVDLSLLPELARYVPTACYLAWRITLETEATITEIREVFEWVSNCCALEIDQAAEPSLAAAPGQADNATQTPDAAQDARRDPGLVTMHVRTEKIDDLVNLVGELVITHTMLRQSTRHFDPVRDAKALSVFAQLERNVQDLQERVLAIRMMPVNHVFGRFPRLVRDLGLQLGKAVELKISGEQAELDKSVIERLIDPLTHLVRNALDHGIEIPADRLSAGKLGRGTIALHAEHRGGRFVITVTDDGRGINPEMVRRRAVEIGFLRPDEEIDEARVFALIMRPGFSTAQKVSNVSGRGVGLDVVGQNVRELGGSLEITSVVGAGTKFTIQLPLTLAIVDGMIVRAATETYIIPIAFIRECIQVLPGQVQSVVGQGHVIHRRGEYIPILRLSDVCGLEDDSPAEQSVLVVLEVENRVIALQVGELMGQDQVVIKSLEANYRKVEYMAGASILGDGRVALILDVTAIVKKHAEIQSRAPSRAVKVA